MNPDKCELLYCYNFLANDDNELLLELPGYFPGEPENAVILYDGGADAIFIRSGSDAVTLDCIHPQVRPILDALDTVLIAEIDSKYQYMADVIHRDITVEIARIRSDFLYRFPLHPFPAHTGAFVRGSAVCSICGSETQLSFRSGLLHCRKPLGPDSPICPSCIQSGRAAEELGGCFTPVYRLDDPEAESADEVMFRTPSYQAAGSTGYWPDHCGCACVYLGRIKFEDMGPGLLTELFNLDETPEDETGSENDSPGDMSPSNTRIEEKLKLIDKAGAGQCEPHMFRCRKCGRHILRLADTEDLQYSGRQ